MRRIRRLDEPSMSDKTLLVSVEDLINRALGPAHCNVVNYKLIHTILHILARQMRMLEQLVEIKMSDLEDLEDGYPEQSSVKSSPTKGSPSRRSPIKDRSDKSKSPPRRGEKHINERDKADKGGKDGERAERGSSKDRASKEREKGEKDRTKEDKAATKERERAEKIAAKAAKGTDREKSKERPKKLSSGASIAISEVERQKEKVLVVEKGPSTTSRHERRSLEVVTRSEFDLLEAMVRQIGELAGPLPLPALPTNRKLRSDIAAGHASLTDTMEAMQLSARVHAAERAVSQMADLLTQLAAAGALPREVADMVSELESPRAVQGEMKRRPSAVSHKSVGIHPSMLDEHSEPRVSRAPSRFSVAASRASMRSSMVPPASIDEEMPGVTHPEMDVAMQALREELMKQAQTITHRANAVADSAHHTARDVSEKLMIAIGLSDRISTLNGQVMDYAEQLSGFDTGLSSQMTSFRDQMTQMRGELKEGLAQLALVNNNAETAAVTDLTERYELLVSEMGRTTHAHTGLITFQQQLAEELKSLVECVEMLREQKADRDEVLDGLRDKADNSRLAGLLTSLEFAVARAEIEARLAVCHDKFHKQDTAWMTALKDLCKVAEEKAELTQLLAARDDAKEKLRELQDMQNKLAAALGEPKLEMNAVELKCSLSRAGMGKGFSYRANIYYQNLAWQQGKYASGFAAMNRKPLMEWTEIKLESAVSVKDTRHMKTFGG
ncbi:hypothetical protein evm_008574 [Chilo suppressalis]|nr:hypothetical protein evm_008574 [Chilo suppressalis]